MNNIELNNYLEKNKIIKIELGCGMSKKNGYLGIDAVNLPNVDIVATLEDGLPFLPDNSIDEILTIHTLEHIQNFEFLLKEMHRVLKSNSKIVIYVPHFSNPYFYSDSTHKRFFGLYTFDYFATSNTNHKRKVALFYTDLLFIINKRKFIFKSVFKIRNYLKQIQKRVFNLNPFLQEFYEENLCFIFPCQEIYFELSVIK